VKNARFFFQSHKKPIFQYSKARKTSRKNNNTNHFFTVVVLSLSSVQKKKIGKINTSSVQLSILKGEKLSRFPEIANGLTFSTPQKPPNQVSLQMVHDQ
jgi:hypothetical protein